MKPSRYPESATGGENPEMITTVPHKELIEEPLSLDEQRERAYQEAKEKEGLAIQVAKIWYPQLTRFMTQSGYLERTNQKPPILTSSIFARLRDEARIDSGILGRLEYFGGSVQTVTRQGKTRLETVQENGYLMLGLSRESFHQQKIRSAVPKGRFVTKEEPDDGRERTFVIEESAKVHTGKLLGEVESLRFVPVSEAENERARPGEAVCEVGLADFMDQYLEVMRLEGAISQEGKDEILQKIDGASSLKSARLIFEFQEDKGQTQIVSLSLEPTFGRELGGQERYGKVEELRR